MIQKSTVPECFIIKKIGLHNRAERLKNISDYIIKKHKGIVPEEKDELMSIHGVGDYISNAVLCFGYNKPYPIVDTNVIRIYERIFNVKSAKKRPRNDKKIWEFAEAVLPKTQYVDFNYALLDFASEICKARKPECKVCTFYEICINNELC